MSNIYLYKNINNKEEIENLKNLVNNVDNASTNALINISTLQNLDNETKKNLQQGDRLNNSLESNINNGNNLGNELLNNIKNANSTNKSLIDNGEKATSKNIELQKSLDETKKYIANLDGSQNLPQMRNDITELQNGIKKNQNINYAGTSLTCNDTLNGRTKGMCIKGSTKYQRLDGTLIDAWEKNVVIKSSGNLNDNTINIYSINRDIRLVWRGNLLMYKPAVEGDYIVSPQNNNYYGLMINITNVPTGKEIKIVSPGIFNRITTFSKSFINNDSLDESSKIRSIYEINTGTNNISFVKSSNENYLFIGCYDLMKMNRQIELNILDFDKKEISLPIEGLKSLPNGIYDMIYENNLKVILEQRIRGCLLDGTENWTKHLENEKYISFYKTTADAVTNINSKAIISDKFTPATYSEYNSLLFESITLNNSNSTLILISILKDKLETKDSVGFKKWLQTNPTTVYYQLSEPIYHNLNVVDIDLNTYESISYINSGNKIKPILDFKVPSNLAGIVQSNSKAINELYELIDRLLIPNITNNTMNIALK